MDHLHITVDLKQIGLAKVLWCLRLLPYSCSVHIEAAPADIDHIMDPTLPWER